MARDFDNADDYVRLLTTASALKVDTFTVSVWADPDNSDGFIASHMDFGGGAFGWNLYVNTGGNDGKVRYELHTTATNQINSTTNVVSTAGWHHIVATYDGSFQRLYINGVEEANVGKSGTVNYGATADIFVGNDETLAFDYDGRAAELALWSGAFSATQVANLYAANHVFSFPNLLLYWPLFGTSSPEPDWAGGGNHGTVSGAVQADHPPHIGVWGGMTSRMDTVPASDPGTSIPDLWKFNQNWWHQPHITPSIAGTGGRGICG